MKKGGVFSKFLEAMGIMVETVEDGAYDASKDYGDYAEPPQDDYEQQSYQQPQQSQQTMYDSAQSETYTQPQEPMQDTGSYRPRRSTAAENTYKARETRAQKGNVINMHNQSAAQAQPMRNTGAPSMSVLVYRPSSFEDTQKIIDNVKAQRPVIVNLDALDVDEAQRSLDFISGASYALNGTVFKVASSIFVLAPYNIDITGNIQNEMYPQSEDDYYDDGLVR